MHDGKCNELLVREETIHGRGPAKAVYIPNLLPSLRFLRLVIFLHYYWLLREQLFPSLLPIRITILTLTDRQLMGKLAACMRRSNSAMKLMCCIKGDVLQSCGKEEEEGGGGRRSRFKRSLGPARTGSARWRWSRLFLAEMRFSQKSDSPCFHAFIYLFTQLFIHLFIQFPRRRLWLQIPKLAAFHSLKIKTLEAKRYIFKFQGKVQAVDTIIESSRSYNTSPPPSLQPPKKILLH